MKLIHSQKEANEKLSAVKVGALFMEPGTGKTLTVTELIKGIEGEKEVFWFTPFQTKSNLRAELDKWGGFECDIIGTESLSNSDRLYLRLYSKIQTSLNPIIVVDESLKIKNSDAKRTKRLLSLSQMCAYKFILNGTPISRNLLDLWSQMEFLSPLILNMSETQFKNTFCEYLTTAYRTPNRGRSYSREFIRKYHNLDYLYSLIEPYVFESKLSISVGLQHINIDYHLSRDEIKEHERLKTKYLDDKMLLARNNNIFLELTQKMQNNYSRSEEKFQIVKKLLRNDNPDRFLIYAKYIETQEMLKKRFPDVKVMSLGKHSYGLNLQHYNRIVVFDKTWDYAQLDQLIHRVYRTGQKNDIIVYGLTSNAGLCSLMNGNIDKKGKLLQEFKVLSNERLKEIL